jgi:hypothetical protein
MLLATIRLNVTARRRRARTSAGGVLRFDCQAVTAEEQA